MIFINFYRHCDRVWIDVWDCACNDECPVCRKEIEPYKYEEHEGDISHKLRKVGRGGDYPC
jgi:hypothetical protein